MARLKSGDTVEVISGAEKGKRGKVLNVDLGSGRVTVQGVNMVYKHLRKNVYSKERFALLHSRNSTQREWDVSP